MPEERTLLEETEPKDIKEIGERISEGAFGFVVANVGGVACILLMNQHCTGFSTEFSLIS